MYFHRFLQNCSYFLRVTTHSESRVFIGAPFALIIVANVYLFSQDCYTICKLTFLLRWLMSIKKTGILSSGLQRMLKTESSPMRLWYYQVHAHVVIFWGLPHSLQACVLTAERSRHMCRLSLYWVALVVVDLTRHLITLEVLLSLLQADSLLGRLCILPWLREAGVRQDSM